MSSGIISFTKISGVEEQVKNGDTHSMIYFQTTLSISKTLWVSGTLSLSKLCISQNFF